VECDRPFGFLPKRKIQGKVARFRQLETEHIYAHRDAFEFPDGEVVILTTLSEGQHATVLQLPASRVTSKAEDPTRTPVRAELVRSVWSVR
jgi:hypothetical protein